MLVRLEYLSATKEGHIFKEPISGAVLVFTDEQTTEVSEMYSDLRDAIDAVARLAKATDSPYKPGQAHRGQLTIPGLLPASQGPATGQETPSMPLQIAPDPARSDTKPETPVEQEIEQSDQQDEWLFGEDANKSHLPYRVNDDVEAQPDRMIAIIETLDKHYETLDDRQRHKAAERIADIPVHERVKYKDSIPDGLRQMVVTIILGRDGLKSSLIPAAEAVFLGHGEPDFGLNKEAPPASIPKGFGETELGPATKYRSAASLSSMLKGTTETKSD